MFFRTPFFLPLLYPGLIWRMHTEEKIIYLTFDDGPVPGPTEFVLDTLKQFNAKATFFCIGDNVNKHPKVFQRITAEGHTVGNHTFNHLKGWNYSTEDYLSNTNQCEKQFIVSGYQFPVTGNRKLFRPPYGRITPKQIKSLKEGEYNIVMWDVLTSDYNKNITPEKCLNGSIAATRAGSIVVFHDSVKAERNMKYTLPRYIEHFTKQGFSFQSLIPNA
jgi:peptidoglycan-N-acetylglucosamine deacetylase